MAIQFLACHCCTEDIVNPLQGPSACAGRLLVLERLRLLSHRLDLNMCSGSFKLSMAIDALVCGSTICSGSGSSGGDIGNGDDTDSGGDCVCGSGDEYNVSGNGSRVDMAKCLSTSAPNENGIGV
ncbi:hypothetical protein Tco_0164075 [Tanacetum coccineum]